MINPLFQNKEGSTFFRQQAEKNDAFGPSVDNDHFFDPMLQKESEDKGEEAVQSAAKEEEAVQSAAEEEESVQAKGEEEEAVQSAGEEEESMQAKGEEEEAVQSAEKEEEAVQPAAEEEESVQAKGEEEEAVQSAAEEESVQAKEESGGKDSQRQRQADGIESTLFQEKGKGRQVDAGTRKLMEKKFGADFSKVRIHTGQKAQLMNQKIHAKAFAHGFDIFFNQGQYKPETSEGKHLLAHELTHTIQQKGITQKPVQPRLNDGHDFHPMSRFATNETLEATLDNFATVNMGSNGAHVTKLQYALIGLGYPLPRFGADGSFGGETKRAVEAFQEDVGLTVDGVVGRDTIKYLDKRDRGLEVAPPEGPVTISSSVDLKNVITQPGAVPTPDMPFGVLGKTFPENIDVRLELLDNGATWQPVLTGVTGNYSIQTRLLPGISEVTGPGGNTNEENYCDQIRDLSNLSLAYSEWYMEDAILAHEREHASKIREALIDPSVLGHLEKSIQEISIPKSAITINEILAEVMIRLDPKFQDMVLDVELNWIDQFILLLSDDHGIPNGTGPAYDAERKIVNPMKRKIWNHAKANRWSSCAHSRN